MNKEHITVQLLVRNWPFPRGSGRIIDRVFSKIKFSEQIASVMTTDGFKMLVPPNDHIGRHIYLSGEFDRTTAEVLITVSKPGDILLDIGANLGYVSACFLQRVENSRCISV